MNANVVALLYLVSGVLFILALHGLSNPVRSRQGNPFGMIGMTIAVLTTLGQLGDYSMKPGCLSCSVSGSAQRSAPTRRGPSP